MIGYTRHWDCNLCQEHQDTIDYPRVLVCEKCLRPLAERLCVNSLGKGLTAEGLDVPYWMAKAQRLATVLLGRWVPRLTKQHVEITSAVISEKEKHHTA